MIGWNGISPEDERRILRCWLIEKYHWTFDEADSVVRERPLIIRQQLAFIEAQSKRNAK